LPRQSESNELSNHLHFSLKITANEKKYLNEKTESTSPSTSTSTSTSSSLSTSLNENSSVQVDSQSDTSVNTKNLVVYKQNIHNQKRFETKEGLDKAEDGLIFNNEKDHVRFQ
jgi:hypothetical protein